MPEASAPRDGAPETSASEPEPPRVTCTIAGGVADVRLNRPNKLNAIDLHTFDALIALGEQLAANRSIRAVVLSGEGRGFCAGLDFSAFQAMATRGVNSGPVNSLGQRESGRITNRAQQAAYTWTELPVPVIAAIHGVALGGGLQIALGADLRFVSPDARLSVLEIRWGLVPDMTGTDVLPRLVGLDVAKELTWSGRIVEGQEAVRLGLATRLADDPRHEALSFATELAAKSPEAIRGAKALLNSSGQTSRREQFAAESRTMAGLIASPAQQEAINAYFEKRAPVFSDPG